MVSRPRKGPRRAGPKPDVPTRTCIGCRGEFPRSSLVRVIRGPAGEYGIVTCVGPAGARTSAMTGPASRPRSNVRRSHERSYTSSSTRRPRMERPSSKRRSRPSRPGLATLWSSRVEPGRPSRGLTSSRPPSEQTGSCCSCWRKTQPRRRRPAFGPWRSVRASRSRSLAHATLSARLKAARWSRPLRLKLSRGPHDYRRSLAGAAAFWLRPESESLYYAPDPRRPCCPAARG